jgi:putative transcriptional regulator
MVRSLEQGKRHAHGAILKLLNIVERHGINGLL